MALKLEISGQFLIEYKEGEVWQVHERVDNAILNDGLLEVIYAVLGSYSSGIHSDTYSEFSKLAVGNGGSLSSTAYTDSSLQNELGSWLWDTIEMDSTYTILYKYYMGVTDFNGNTIDEVGVKNGDDDFLSRAVLEESILKTSSKEIRFKYYLTIGRG